MSKMKKLSVLLGVASLLLLAACGQKLTVQQPQYQQAKMTAVVAGKVSGSKTVDYQTGESRGRVKVDQGKFRIAVPTTTKVQTLTVKAGRQTVKRQLQAASALGSYAQIAKRYNQTLIFAALPKRMQAEALALPKLQAQIKTMPPAQQLKLSQEAAALKKAMAQVTAATKAEQWPAFASGQQEILTKKTSSVHLNVQGGQLMSVTIAIAPAALKSKSAQTRLAQQLGLLANTLGANVQQVGSQIQGLLDGRGKLHQQTIIDHGIKFQVGTTLTQAYLFVTK